MPQVHIKDNNLGPFPAWAFRDDVTQFPDADNPALPENLDRLHADSVAFHENYIGRVNILTLAEFAIAMRTYEELDERRANLDASSFVYSSIQPNGPGRRDIRKAVLALKSDVTHNRQFFEQEAANLTAEKLASLLTDPDVQKYDFWLREQRKYLPYQLSNVAQRAVAADKLISDNCAEQYTTLIADLKFIDGDNSYALAELRKMRAATDAAQRQLAYRGIEALLYDNVIEITDLMEVILANRTREDIKRGYETATAHNFLASNIAPETVGAMIDAVDTARPKLAHRYWAWKADLLGHPDHVLPHWEQMAPLPTAETAVIPFPNAQQMIVTAFGKFSPQLAEIVAGFFEGDAPWFDAAPTAGKAGYAAYTYERAPHHPYMFVNSYGGTPHDVLVVAHECGHGIHSVLRAPQGGLADVVPQMINETASIFAELLVFEELLATAGSQAEADVLIGRFAEKYINLTVGQVGLFRIEQDFAAAALAGKLTPKIAGALNLEHLRAVAGPAVVIPDSAQFSYGLTSQLFLPDESFYNYPYAVGALFAIALFQIYKQQPTSAAKKIFADQFTEALAAGATKTISEFAEGFGLNINNSRFWQAGLSYIGDYVDGLMLRSQQRLAAAPKSDNNHAMGPIPNI